MRKFYNFARFRKNFTRYSVKSVRSHEVVLFWLKSILTRNQFLILSGILVGTTCGLAGVILKSLVHYIHYLITYKVYFTQQLMFYAIFPFLGIVITSLVVIFIFKGKDKKGIPVILNEIAKNSSIVSPVKMYSQIVQSAITVGLGGSAGLESPIAVTGAAIGSNYAQTYKLQYRERTLLLAAGATAGIASAFNAPIAGVMFAMEILLTGVVFSDFIPLVVAAVCGSLVSRILLDEEVLFQFRMRNPFDYHNIPFYLILGIICGLYARYFLVIGKNVEHFFKHLRYSRLQKAMLGGAVLSVLCVLYPPLFGEGYEMVKVLASGNVRSLVENSLFDLVSYSEWVVVIFVAVVCLLKAFATSITIYSGGNGGNFAPSLFAGAAMGFILAGVSALLGIDNVPATNLVIVGMAGVMSGVMYAPLTAIFLIAESSSGYDLFIPLMIVSVTSFLMAKWFSAISPDLEHLAKEGMIFTDKHDQNLLSRLRTLDLIDKDTQEINVNASFTELTSQVRTGKKNIIAVLNDERQLVGIITIDDLRPVLFNQNDFNSLSIRSIMKLPSGVIEENDSVVVVAEKFDKTGAWNLPIVRADGGTFVGFISKSNVLNSYRKLLQEYSG